MRRCSRCSDADRSFCFSGCGATGASASLGMLPLEHAASIRPSSANAAVRRKPAPLSDRTTAVRALLMTALRDLDLFGRRRLDPRAAALLDRAPHPNMLAGVLLQLQPGVREVARVALLHRNGESVRPAAREIDVARGRPSPSSPGF